MLSSKAFSLEEVIATEELRTRPSRSVDRDSETGITLKLVRDLAQQPAEFFGRLAAAVLQLANAESAGVSILLEDEKRFIWPAVRGELSPYLGGGTPSGFGPCGTVIERDAVVLFVHPERHFTYLEPISPPLEEVLLAPFRVDGKPVGTIWAVIHVAGRQFDPEDLRLLENLAEFAASAYRTLTSTDALKNILGRLPKPAAQGSLTQAGKTAKKTAKKM